jgi:drug/metabolite transporter (DMT)-like permease
MSLFSKVVPRRRQLAADALLLLVTLIWGSTFVMVKDAVAAYPVFPFLALRFWLATVVLLVIGGRRLPSLGWRGLGAGVLIGLFLFAGYGFQTLGLRYTSASKAGFITGLSVVLVPVLSTLLLRRRPGPAATIGVGLAAVGLGFLTLHQGLRLEIGDLLLLGCAFSFALHIISVSAFAPSLDPVALTVVQVATVAIASTVLGLFGGEPWHVPSSSTLFAAGFTGVLATAAAFAIQTAMQRFTTPTHTALIFAAEPVFAAVFGVLLAHDVLGPSAIAGGVLIVTGMVISEINWSHRAARLISRFLSPHYVAAPLLVILGLSDPVSWWRGLLWAAGIGVPAIAGPLIIFSRQLRQGKISDWYMSRREERLRPVPVILSVLVAIIPLTLLLVFHGPRVLVVAFTSASALILVNLVITTRWKISQHVSSVAACTLLLTATLGIAAAPLLLLIPLVAWARVKVQAHTLMQAIAGGLAGVLIPLTTIYLFRIA